MSDSIVAVQNNTQSLEDIWSRLPHCLYDDFHDFISSCNEHKVANIYQNIDELYDFINQIIIHFQGLDWSKYEINALRWYFLLSITEYTLWSKTRVEIVQKQSNLFSDK